MRVATVLSVLLLTSVTAAREPGPAPVLLWPGGAPGAAGDDEQDQPSLRAYRPQKPNGVAIVVCPGGGYGALAFDHEGHQVAEWLAGQGVRAFVLRYRHAPAYRHPIPLGDVQRAIRLVRSRAQQWQVDPGRLGVMGFSAGGHLASTAATHYDNGSPEPVDGIDRHSCRPDFAVLCYPVISMVESYGHAGSRRNLLGERADDKELAELLSSERQVTEDTPPMFLFHTAEDPGVKVENSLAMFSALRRHGVAAELHVYQHGPHGVGLAEGDPVLSTWSERLLGWLATSGLLAPVQRAAVQGAVKLDGQPLRWGSIALVPDRDRGGPPLPTAWALISGGRFSIPAHRGAVVGRCKIEVRSLGDVVPRPTQEGVKVLSDGSVLTFEVAADESNMLDLELSR